MEQHIKITGNGVSNGVSILMAENAVQNLQRPYHKGAAYTGQLSRAEKPHPIVDKLQSNYNANRSSMWVGTPAVSEQFFDEWRDHGLWRAYGYLVDREKDLGNPKIPASVKAACNMAGSLLFSLSVERIVKESDEDNTSRRGGKARIIKALGLLPIATALVAAGQGSPNATPTSTSDTYKIVTDTNYVGKESPELCIQKTLSTAGITEKSFTIGNQTDTVVFDLNPQNGQLSVTVEGPLGSKTQGIPLVDQEEIVIKDTEKGERRGAFYLNVFKNSTVIVNISQEGTQPNNCADIKYQKNQISLTQLGKQPWQETKTMRREKPPVDRSIASNRGRSVNLG